MKRLPYYFGMLLVLLSLAACNTTSVNSRSNNNNNDNDDALITDVDIDSAILALVDNEEIVDGIEGAAIPDGEEVDLSNGNDFEVTTQAALPNSNGHTYYIERDPTRGRPWRLWCFNQATNTKTRIYVGKRKIQSVAGDTTCTIIVFAMEESVNGDLEVYRFDGNLTQLTSNKVDETNVSLSADATVVVWERPIRGVQTISYRIYTSLVDFTQKNLRRPFPQIQPSISGDGADIALIRLTRKNKIVIYNIASKTYTTVFNTSRDIENPSSSNGQGRVAWLEHHNSRDQIRMKNLTTGTVSTLLTRKLIEHPHLASNGLWLVYGQTKNGSVDVYMLNTNTGQKRRGTVSKNPSNHSGMYWQVSNTLTEIIYGLTIDNTLIKLDPSLPTASPSVDISGLNPNTVLIGMDYRPFNSLLYALGNDGQFYTLDNDGTAHKIGPPQDYDGADFSEGIAMDFNPQVDALRVITTADGRNFVTDPFTGFPTEFTTSAYDASDPNSGVVPKVVATAYDNNVSPFPADGTTTQYSLEATADTLTIQAKNAGTLTTVADLGIDIDNVASFDISGETGLAYALIETSSTLSLSSIKFKLIKVLDPKTGESVRRIALEGEENAITDVTSTPNGIKNADPYVFCPKPPSDYDRVDRAGQPATATVFISSGNKDDYNQEDPSDDVTGNRVPEISNILDIFHNALDDDLEDLNLVPCLVEACLNVIGSLIIPDVLFFSTIHESGYPNGRRLEDQVIDIILAAALLDLNVHTFTLLAGLPLNPPANDVPFSNKFPFLAPPN